MIRRILAVILAGGVIASVPAAWAYFTATGSGSAPFSVQVAQASAECPNFTDVESVGLPAGSAPTVECVSSGTVLRFGIPAGATGAQGPTGPTGPAGADGEDGAQGPAGFSVVSSPESAGANCAHGGSRFSVIGSFDTYACDGATGAQGPQGVQGPTGPTGATGAQGEQGPQGDPGPAGVQGPKGDDGATGATGSTGPSGPSGPAGPAGTSGWEVKTATTTVGASSANQAQADCSPGKKVLGGGISGGQDGNPASVITSFPISGGTGWIARFRTNSSSSNITVYAICANVS